MVEFVGHSRALETTLTEGTADYALEGVPGGGYVGIVAGIGDGKGGFFVCRGNPGETDEDEREILWGVVADGSPDVVARTTILDSTNGGSKVMWSAGTKTIYAIAPGELIAEMANVGYSASGTRPATITMRGKGLWIKADVAPRIWYFYNGTVDIPLLLIDEAGGVVSLIGSGALLTSVDAGATAGPTIEGFRDSASPAASDLLGTLLLTGRSSTAVKRSYAEIAAKIVSPTNAAEAGALLFNRMVAGALTLGLTLKDRLLAACAVETAKGADVASAATCDIWTPGDGNLLHVTGTTTITSFGTAPQAGATRELIFDGALVLTNGANLVLNGGANITTAAGDRARVRADTTTKMIVDVIPVSGKAVVPSGIVQQVYAEDTASHAFATSPIPADNTIPQSTEGDEWITLSITPKNAANLLLINVNVMVSCAGLGVIALFKDTDTDALAVAGVRPPDTSVITSGTLIYRRTAGGTSAITFKVRVGVSTGTFYVNRTSSGALYGGAMVSSICITEIAA